MTHCPRCLKQFGDHCTACPDCGEPTVRGSAPLGRAEKREERLVCVYRLDDRVAAGAVMGLLEQAGIRATVREDSAEHLFGVASLEMGRFGGVCVLEPDAGRAAELIEEYLRAVGAPESTEERGAAQ